MITVQSLIIYPIKSLGAIHVNSMAFDEYGPLHDRRFMLIDDKNRMLTQRKIPEMAMFQPSIHDNLLSVSYKSTSCDFSMTETEGEPINSVIWGDDVIGEEVNADISAWFSERLNRPVRLIKQARQYKRQMDQEFVTYQAEVGFADGFQLLLTQQSSLEALGLGENENMLRFRPNIVVTGGKAFEEDYWQRITVASATLNVVKPCSRCSMPAVNPKDASRQPDVIRTLAQKRLFNKKTYFGQNVVLDAERNIAPLQLTVGDQVSVVKKTALSNLPNAS